MKYHATYGTKSIGDVTWTFRIVNPHSILTAFDKWFAFECRMNGIGEFDPDDYPLF